jgi:SPP1 gp7 family putative phage head morphogenesis protein
MATLPELDKWIRQVDPRFWERHKAELNRSVAPLMASNFLDQSQLMLDNYPFIGVEWGIVNEAAADWARKYTFELVTKLTDTSERTLQKLIPRFFEEQMTQGQLREALTPTFGMVRAEMIARTEVTRAASEAEKEMAKELEEQGIKMVPIWNTREDEIVCPICGPRNGLEIIDDEYPPIHPNCRCNLSHELPKGEA